MKMKVSRLAGVALISAAIAAPIAHATDTPSTTATGASVPAQTQPTPSGWEAYEPANGGSVVSGSFEIAPDGTVSGTLPPGTSKTDPPEVPGNPEVADAIRDASPAESAGLRTAPKPKPGESINLGPAGARTKAITGPASTRAAADNPDDGCVHARSSISAGGITFWGYATGCARGDLLMRTWLRVGGSTVVGYKNKYCDGSTGCSQANDPRTYTPNPNCGVVTNYADVKNRTTNGYSQAWQDHYPIPGCS